MQPRSGISTGNATSHLIAAIRATTKPIERARKFSPPRRPLIGLNDKIVKCAILVIQSPRFGRRFPPECCPRVTHKPDIEHARGRHDKLAKNAASRAFVFMVLTAALADSPVAQVLNRWNDTRMFRARLLAACTHIIAPTPSTISIGKPRSRISSARSARQIAGREDGAINRKRSSRKVLPLHQIARVNEPGNLCKRAAVEHAINRPVGSYCGTQTGAHGKRDTGGWPSTSSKFSITSKVSMSTQDK